MTKHTSTRVKNGSIKKTPAYLLWTLFFVSLHTNKVLNLYQFQFDFAIKKIQIVESLKTFSIIDSKIVKCSKRNACIMNPLIWTERCMFVSYGCIFQFTFPHTQYKYVCINLQTEIIIMCSYVFLLNMRIIYRWYIINNFVMQKCNCCALYFIQRKIMQRKYVCVCVARNEITIDSNGNDDVELLEPTNKYPAKTGKMIQFVYFCLQAFKVRA